MSQPASNQFRASLEDVQTSCPGSVRAGGDKESDLTADIKRLVMSTRKLLSPVTYSSEKCLPTITFCSSDGQAVRPGTLIRFQSQPNLVIQRSGASTLSSISFEETDLLMPTSARDVSPSVVALQDRPRSMTNLPTVDGQNDQESIRLVAIDTQSAVKKGEERPEARDSCPSILKVEKLLGLPPSLLKGPKPDDLGRLTQTKSSAAVGLPDFGQTIPCSSGGNRLASRGGSLQKNKITGIAFFRIKPNSSSTPAKALQMKELKRMIRLGKPSYEQINSWRQSFEKLLGDPFGLALFKDFLSTEFSDENIEFWIACEDYKQTSNPKKLATKLQRIFFEFVAVQANREVNLDSKTRLETEEELANPTLHSLESAQKRIQALMEKDSYRRFLRSEVYLTLYSEAREVTKAVAATALAASLQTATEELEGGVLQLINTLPSHVTPGGGSSSAIGSSPFSFLANFSASFGTGGTGKGLNLPGVAAAAASAEAGMNSVQDLQLLGLSTSRHMRGVSGTARPRGAGTSGGGSRTGN